MAVQESQSFALEMAKVVIPSLFSFAGLVVTAFLSIKLATIEKNVRTIEIATNSMKDALVESTAKENLATGIGQGVEQERLRVESKGEGIA